MAASNSLVQAMSHLVLPGLFFICLGFLLRRKSFVTDIKTVAHEVSLNLKLAAFNVVFAAPIIFFAYQGVFDLAAARGWQWVSPEFWAGLPSLLVIFLTVFIADFICYWRHRFEHSRLLWPSHAVHHSDTEMTWTTLLRFHPLNKFTTVLIDGTLMLLLGIPPFAMMVNRMVRSLYGYFVHANIPWTYGPLGRIFVSPAMHRWHHALDPRFFQTNFAAVFSVFDQAFGTYKVPGPCDAPLGVTDQIEPSLSAQLGYAFTPRAYKRLFAKPDPSGIQAAE